MYSNIEIKARANNFERQREIAKKIADAAGEQVSQEDIFFNITKGRLKLRILDDTLGELIFYKRADSSGPKVSHYEISKTNEPEALKHVFSSSLGVRGVVRKQRTLYRVGYIRIHLDQVEDLGDFIELEYVMNGNRAEDEAFNALKNLMGRLEIRDDDLIGQAYIDLILR